MAEPEAIASGKLNLVEQLLLILCLLSYNALATTDSILLRNVVMTAGVNDLGEEYPGCGRILLWF